MLNDKEIKVQMPKLKCQIKRMPNVKVQSWESLENRKNEL
jgi:hypothetical protein